MILPFSTKLNGLETDFVEKIAQSLYYTKFKDWYDDNIDSNYGGKYEFKVARFLKAAPKIHSIRADENNRWKEGTKIDFFINNRTKKMVRIAPQVACISVQNILIVSKLKHIVVSNTNRVKNLSDSQIEQLALNDGFESAEAFFDYFKEDFGGKLIHWTKHRY